MEMTTLNESAYSQMKTKGVLQEFARLSKISTTMWQNHCLCT